RPAEPVLATPPEPAPYAVGGERVGRQLAEGQVGAVLSLPATTFPTATADLGGGAKQTLDQIGQTMHAYPNIKVRIEGHTDASGDPAANRTLSEARAAAIKNALVARGINASRIETAGFGSDHPIANNDTEEGRAKNRRTDIVITAR